MKNVARMALAALMIASCSTQPKTPPPPVEAPPPKCLAAQVNHYFDGRQERKGDTWIVMDLDRVVSIGDAHPGDCTTLDLRGGFVLPGLVDGHTHVFFTDRDYGRNVSEQLTSNSNQSKERRVALAHDYLGSLLRNGITAVRDLGNSGQFLDVEFRSQSFAHLPRMYGSGPGIAVATAQFPPDAPKEAIQREYKIVSSIGDVDKAIKDLHANKVSLIKIYSDNDPQPTVMSQDILDAAVKFAHQKNLRITAHATNDATARRAIRAGVDSIEHGYELEDETLASMAEARVALVATDHGERTCQMIVQHVKDTPDVTCTSLKRQVARRLLSARDRGVDVMFGSDMYFVLDGELKDRGPASLDALVGMVQKGFHPREAIRAATSTAGKVIGDDKLGVIEQGSYADLVAYEKNPLRDIEAVRRPKVVIKSGRVVCGPWSPKACR